MSKLRLLFNSIAVHATMSPYKSPFDIKSASIDALALHLYTLDLARLEQAFSVRLAKRAGQLLHEPTLLDLATLEVNTSVDELLALRELTARFGLQAISIRHPDSSLADIAAAAGLGWMPPVIESTRLLAATAEAIPDAIATPAPEADIPATTGETAAVVAATEEEVSVSTEQPATVIEQHPIAAAETIVDKPALPTRHKTLIIDKPVRTGQQIYAKGSDLIVLATISGGAEVIADGNIHIYAPLRGRALAGAHGDMSARIFVHRFEPELISIAGFYRTFDTEPPVSLKGHSVQVYLDAERLVIAPLT